MQILDIKVLTGPNFWSIRRPKLIQMKLDLEDLEYRPSNMIEGFRERIEQLLPTMIEHQCSEGHRGGFFKRVEDGTWMGHIIEHIALEIQSLAGMDLGFGRTRSTGEREGIYNVVFEYELEEAGIYTAKAAVRIAQALIDGVEYKIEADIQTLQELNLKNKPHHLAGILKEASKRKIPVIHSNKQPSIQLGYGINQKRVKIDTISNTSVISLDDLFPNGNNGHIPLIAITGSKGKTTTAQIVAQIAQTAGKNVGYSSLNNAFINNQLIKYNDISEIDPSLLVLQEPTVDFAVLQSNHQQIVTKGLVFQHCDIAIVTNISSDSIGADGIYDIEQLTRVIQVVPETVPDQGYAVLNADDDWVYNMQKELRSQIALYSIDKNNPRIKKHCKSGGIAAVFDNGSVYIITSGGKIQVMPIKEIPIANSRQTLTYLLAAIVSTYLCKGITVEDIRQALQTFTSFSSQELAQLAYTE